MSCVTWPSCFAGNFRTRFPYSMIRINEIMPLTVARSAPPTPARHPVRAVLNAQGFERAFPRFRPGEASPLPPPP